MKHIYIIQITQTSGWAGKFDVARIYMYDEAFTTRTEAELAASHIEHTSRFGCSARVMELGIR